MKTFENYIRNFHYSAIPEMKITSKQLLELLPGESVQVIDIRFKEEYEMWNTGNFKNIPINELPDRLNELDSDKLIVTVCPKNVRSNIAMHYLKTEGYNVKFLFDGLLTLNTMLLGGDARNMHDLLYAE